MNSSVCTFSVGHGKEHSETKILQSRAPLRQATNAFFSAVFFVRPALKKDFDLEPFNCAP